MRRPWHVFTASSLNLHSVPIARPFHRLTVDGGRDWQTTAQEGFWDAVLVEYIHPVDAVPFTYTGARSTALRSGGQRWMFRVALL